MTAPDGEPTKATYVFCRTLFEQLRMLNPTHLVATSDAPRNTLNRKKLLPAYKENRRAKSDEDLIVQIRRIKQITKLLGIPVLQVPGYEADDLIAALVRTYADDGLRITIVTKDKDMHQLLDAPNTRLYHMDDGSFFGPDDVEAKWGVRPHMMTQLQALMGDTSDGVPGVPGIGEKTAAKLLKKYKSIKGLREATDLDPKIAAAIKATDISLMRKLVTLDHSVRLPGRPVRWRGPNKAAAAPVFRALGFTRWAEWE